MCWDRAIEDGWKRWWKCDGLKMVWSKRDWSFFSVLRVYRKWISHNAFFPFQSLIVNESRFFLSFSLSFISLSARCALNAYNGHWQLSNCQFETIPHSLYVCSLCQSSCVFHFCVCILAIMNSLIFFVNFSMRINGQREKDIERTKRVGSEENRRVS